MRKTIVKSGKTPGGRPYYAYKTARGRKETIVGGHYRSGDDGSGKNKLETMTAYRKSTSGPKGTAKKTKTSAWSLNDGSASSVDTKRIKKGPTTAAGSKSRKLGAISAAQLSGAAPPPRSRKR